MLNRARVLSGVAVVVAAVTGYALGTGALAPDVPPPSGPATPSPSVLAVGPADPDDAVAQAARLAPGTAREVEVVDWRRLATGLGVDAPDTLDPAGLARLWTVAATTPAPRLGVLRPWDARLRSSYGFGQGQVAWEAWWLDADGRRAGWAVGLAASTDLDGVRRAVAAGVGPLAGARLDPTTRTLSVGAADEASQSWAADPDVAGVAQGSGLATIVVRGCDSTSDAGRSRADLEPLTGWSVDLGTGLATIRLGRERDDVVARAGLARRDPAFTRTWGEGVVDPADGRLGYRLVDPVAAGRDAAAGRVPPAACATG